MASRLINYSSALNYIAKRTGLPINVVKGWYRVANEDLPKGVNIGTANKMMNKMLSIGFGTTKGDMFPKYPNKKLGCSENTFKNLYNYAMSGRSWNIVNDITKVKYNQKIHSLEDGFNLSGNLYGGGGGGSGASWCTSSGKNSSSSAKSGNGANGENTSIEYTKDGVRHLETCKGGTGALGKSVSSNNSTSGKNGEPAQNGEKRALTIIVNKGDYLTFSIGYGGGGGALCMANNGQHFTAKSGNGSKGGRDDDGIDGGNAKSNLINTFTKGNSYINHTNTGRGANCGDGGEGGVIINREMSGGSGGNSGGFMISSYNNKWVNIL